ncbi:MAG: YqeG family HAD IIIA-type phosphatase [Candidatus Caenarcaniphilales bacterium]|nr:YqeG family HAD IIIA-type phosphatase [Candidatus Caenarcaniphilales bacterium]
MFPLEPTYFIDDTVENLDVNQLIADGVKGLILDLDNTIMRPRAGYFCDAVLPWLEKARGLGLKLIIVTNNKNDQYLKEVEPIIEQHQILMITKAKKPRRLKLREALEQIELPPQNVCIVGDRVLTDILGGRRLGMKTAFVRPLLGNEENRLFRFLRKIELLLLCKPH